MTREHLYHPADELADIRAKIRDLRIQEAALEEHLSHLPNEARQGDRFRATFQRRHIRHLNAGALPASIRENPVFYQLTASSVCTVTPTQGCLRSPEAPADTALRPLVNQVG